MEQREQCELAQTLPSRNRGRRSQITEITERVIAHTDLTDPTDFFWVAFGSKSEENLNENLINKNLENPFDLVETSSLLLQRHASAFEQARSLSLQTYHQSLRDFNQDERKTKIIDS